MTARAHLPSLGALVLVLLSGASARAQTVADFGAVTHDDAERDDEANAQTPAPAPRTSDGFTGGYELVPAETPRRPPAEDRSHDEPERPAAPGPDLWVSRPLSLELHLGAGTPVGELGVVATYAVVPALALGLGVGTGSGPNSVNAHAGAYAQLKPFRWVHNAIVVEGAFSTGPFVPFDPLAGLMGEGDSPIVREHAEWANFVQIAAGWEYRTSGGLVFRFTSGVAFLLNPSSMRCTSEDPSTHVVTDCTSPQSPKSESFETAELSIGQSF